MVHVLATCKCITLLRLVNVVIRQYGISGILLTFPHVENSCEINLPHMVFMIFNFVQCI